MVFVQTPAPVNTAPAGPALIRKIVQGQTQRFKVESDWKGTDQAANYRYTIALEVQRSYEKKALESVMAKLSDLRATYGDHETQSPKAFGAFPLQAGPRGPLRGIVLGGRLTTFAIPLLAWTLPGEELGPDGSFTVASAKEDTDAVYSGSGKQLAGKAGRTKVELHLILGGAKTKLDVKSEFQTSTGRLLSSEGTYEEPGGTLTFKISA